jgi:hypothetical protein
MGENMKRVIQCVYTQMAGDAYQFGMVASNGAERERLSNIFDTKAKAYSFFTDIDDLAVGDIVVVQSDGPSNRLGMAICQVSAIKGLTRHQRELATTWVIQKIDLETHTARLKRAAVEQEIRNKLRDRKDELDELMIYRTLAKDDQEIKDLLHQLATFDSSVKCLLPENSGDEKDTE